jgi:hypothetical protein
MTQRTKWRLTAAALTLVGCGGMLADLAGVQSAKGLLNAWGGSILPRVFSTVDGLETFSSTIWVRFNDRSGQCFEVPLDKSLANRLRGPYNRRNVYGAILVYGPVLQNHPQLGPMVETVLRRSTEEGGPLLSAFQLSGNQLAKIELQLVPKYPHLCTHLKLTRTIDLQRPELERPKP